MEKCSFPKDFTYDEAVTLLKYLGFECRNKGKTSGSRIMFVINSIIYSGGKGGLSGVGESGRYRNKKVNFYCSEAEKMADIEVLRMSARYKLLSYTIHVIV